MQHITSSVPSPPAASDSRKLVEDCLHLLGVLRRGWRFVAIAVVVCLTLAAVHLARTKPVYHASTQLLVLQQGGRPLSVAGGGDPLQQVQAGSSLSTHILLIRSPAIVGRALEGSEKLRHLSAGGVIHSLSVQQPDKAANVLELSYQSGSGDEAEEVLRAVVSSYQQFLKENYQQNANEVIGLIVQARDELGTELKELEQEYLQFRRENPTSTADANGQTFVGRRLDQWDQAINQAMTRALQLQTQLELAERLAGEGAGLDAITNAINQLAGVGGGEAIVVDRPDPGRGDAPGVTYEQLAAELAEVEHQRATAELLLRNLRAELAALAEGRPVDNADVLRRFREDPEVARLEEAISRARAERDRYARVVRSPSDPALRGREEQARILEQQLDRLWQEKRPEILAELAPRVDHESIREAEANLLALRARQATLRERAEQVRVRQLDELRAEEAQLARVHEPGHQALVAVRERIARLDRGQEALRGGQTGHGAEALMDALEESLKAIDAMRADIQQRFEDDLAASREAEITQLAESNLKSNLERQRTLFDSVASQLKQAQLVSDFESVTAQTISPPGVVPIKPSMVSILLMATVVGVGLGGGLAFVADLLDPRVRSLAEMRAQLDMPVLAVIPQLSPEQFPETGRLELLSHQAPRSSLAESYKSARTNLEFIRRNRNAQILLVSSPNPADGKSTTASNLAISVAHTGRRVLLIDADLRKPSQHLHYHLGRDRGMTQVLGGAAAMAEVVQPTAVENLDLVTTGPDAPNPAELLASGRLGEVLDALRPSYDLVIIDSSPLLAVTDPSIISASVDALLLVVRLGNSRRQDVERVKELLGTLGTPVIGAMINGITREHGGYGYGSGYGYGYGRAYGSLPASGPAEQAARPSLPPRAGRIAGDGEALHDTGKRNGKLRHEGVG